MLQKGFQISYTNEIIFYIENIDRITLNSSKFLTLHEHSLAINGKYEILCPLLASYAIHWIGPY